MTDGKAFVIIVKVIKRKFEKQKHASLNWSVLSKVQNCFSERIVITYSYIMVKENTHTGLCFTKRIRNIRDFRNFGSKWCSFYYSTKT